MNFSRKIQVTVKVGFTAIFDTEEHKKSKFYSALKLKWQESEPPESPKDIDIVDVTAP